ncbi:MAG: DUF4276 family protein [Sedimentisphaerales bacterium]|nr:DUF4276 family protein [Sedimentisphaerales bacterium]
MSEVFVYVEGPSDQLGMRELFAHVIELANKKGKAIDFYPLNGKEPLLNKGPIRAINILRNKPNSYVFLVQDLYPKNKPFPHSTYTELKDHVEKRFNEELRRKGCDNRLADRFFVHCFKYDLEALILASEKVLLDRLEKTQFSRQWIKPVENQNHNKPPKRIVETLFHDSGMKYKETADVPWILERSNYQDLTEKCPHNFKPFVVDLLRILEIEAL